MIVESDKNVNDIVNNYYNISQNKPLTNEQSYLKKIVEKDEIMVILSAISIMGEKGIEPVRNLITTYKKKFGKDFNLNRTEGFWTCPLSYAIFLREENFAMFLLDYGADPNFIDEMNCISINYAVSVFDFKSQNIKKENIELKKLIVKLIIKDVNVGHFNPISNMFPDYEATHNNYKFSANQILNKIQSIKKQNNPEEILKIQDYLNEQKIKYNKYQGFFDAMIAKDEQKAIDLLESDTNIVHVLDIYGQTPLHYAVKYKFKKLIKKLILYGVDYKKKSNSNITAADILITLKSSENKNLSSYLLDCIKEKILLDNKKSSKDLESIKENNNSNISEKLKAEEISKLLIEEEEKNNKIKEQQKLKELKHKEMIENKRAEKERLKLKQKKEKDLELEKKKQDEIIRAKKEEQKINFDNKIISLFGNVNNIMNYNIYIRNLKKMKIFFNNLKNLSKSYKSEQKRSYKKLENLKFILYNFFQNELKNNDLKEDYDFKNFLFDSEKELSFWDDNSSLNIDISLKNKLIKYIQNS